MSEADSVVAAPLSFGKLAPLHAVWVERNFPGGSPSDCLLGLGEELGELGDVLADTLRDHGGITTTRMRMQAHDAIGDVAIYLVDFVRRVGAVLANPPIANEVDARARELRPGDEVCLVTEPPPPSVTPLTCFVALASAIGRLDHAYLKWRQGIRGTADQREAKITAAVVEVLEALHLNAFVYGTTLDEIIGRTWAIVGARDWVSNPTTGVAKPE